MMRVSELQALAAKIQAGALAPVDLIILPADQHAFAWNSYSGSLDAAKALHEAVLGDGYVGKGYLYCIWGSGKASVWEIIVGVSYGADIPQKQFHAESPARAWLLAIIRALIAQKGGGL